MLLAFPLKDEENDEMTATRRRDDPPGFEVEASDMGIFTFAKRSMVLLAPMALIAVVFGLWLRAELMAVRLDFVTALRDHTTSEQGLYVTRPEFQWLKQAIEDRAKEAKEANDAQNKMIQKNTVYLERIGQKLGIQRPME